MLQVGLDTSALSLTRAGTARYVTELLSALEEVPEVELRRYSFEGEGRVQKVVRDTDWYLRALPRAAKRDGVDVLHAPTQRAPFRSSVPLVVTIHDVAVLRHPSAFNRWTRAYSSFALPRVARAARRIVVGSEFTRSELVDLLGVPEEKIRVIPYGVGAPFRPDGPSEAGEYVLAVSTLEPRKNLPRLVEGFRRADLDGLELRVVGAEGWGDVRVGGDRVRWLGEVSDDALARLYRGAAAVAYVSLYEGFGLPVLEAMAAGVPVVHSDAPALVEVAGGAGLTVPRGDPAALATALRAVLFDHDKAQVMVAAGRRRAEQFSWEHAAREVWSVHIDLHRSRPRTVIS